MPTNDSDHPVLIVAPFGQDAAAMADLLHAEGVHTATCNVISDCARCITDSTAALLLTEEALEREHLPNLLHVLKAQPSWSELPMIVLASGGEARWNTLLELTAAVPGAVMLLERPMQAVTLLETVRVALRSRRRQYQVRDLLEEQQRNVLERARRAEDLEQALNQRTREVTAAQQQLAQVQRMAAVGTLASGLAHDMSTVLMPLSARLDFVLADSRLTGEHRTDLNVVVALVDHLRQMSRNLSLFSRDPDHDDIEGSTILSQWAGRVQNLIESSTAPHASQRWIRIRWDIPQDLPPAGLAPHRLTQTILNLVHNARDAILAKHQADPSVKPSGLILIEARASADASAVIVKVSDDGVGMTDEVKRRRIEPFYTTRDRPTTAGEASSISSGSGLGLALANSIAQKTGGELRIHSQPDEGTTIELVLPIAAPPSPTANGGLHASTKPRSESRDLKTA